MSQPYIDKAIETGDTDTNGTKWSQALVDNRGRILAGYDEAGTFRCYVDEETLFAQAMVTMLNLAEQLAGKS